MINEQPRHCHFSSPVTSFHTFPRCSSTWWRVSLPSVVVLGAASACVSCRFLPGCVFAFALSSHDDVTLTLWNVCLSSVLCWFVSIHLILHIKMVTFITSFSPTQSWNLEPLEGSPSSLLPRLSSDLAPRPSLRGIRTCRTTLVFYADRCQSDSSQPRFEKEILLSRPCSHFSAVRGFFSDLTEV